METKKNSKMVIIIVLIIIVIIGAGIGIKLLLDNRIKEKTYIGEKTTQEVTESNLAEEEKQLYKKAVARGNVSLLDGKTVETIINEEKDRQAQEQKELEEKRKKEEQEKEELGNAVTLNVYNKNVIPKDTSAWRFSDFVELRMNCKNNTDKDIVAVKGIIHITDLFGNAIMDITLLYDKGTISAKGEVDIKDIGLEVNQFMDKHIKLRDTEFEKLKFTFETESVAFADGTILGESK